MIVGEDAVSDGERSVIVVPCSGIGKAHGTVSREAAYEVTEERRPGSARLVALALLVLGDDEARAAVAAHPTVTIDGCKLACAATMVRGSGGLVAEAFCVLDIQRRHRELKPEGIAELNDGGRQLAHALAEEVTAAVDRLADGDEAGQHA